MRALTRHKESYSIHRAPDSYVGDLGACLHCALLCEALLERIIDVSSEGRALIVHCDHVRVFVVVQVSESLQLRAFLGQLKSNIYLIEACQLYQRSKGYHRVAAPRRAPL